MTTQVSTGFPPKKRPERGQSQTAGNCNIIARCLYGKNQGNFVKSIITALSVDLFVPVLSIMNRLVMIFLL